MSRVTSRPRLLLAIAIGLALLLFAQTVVLAATTKTGGPVKGVKVVTETSLPTIGNMTFTDIPGMSLSMTVPSGEQALLLITFSASTSCGDNVGTPTSSCYVRVLVAGAEALPGQVIFDSARDALDPTDVVGREANSMQFVAGPLSAGTHTVRVQARVSEQYSFVQFHHRTLSVLRSRV